MTQSAARRKPAVSERRSTARKGPSYPSRRGLKLVEGLNKSELIRKYAPKVKIIASGISGKLPPASVELDDLVSVGFIGLMDAADKFEASRGIKFATYAEFRVRGAILDELRNMDGVPRSVRDLAKKIDHVCAELQIRTGTAPSDSDISRILNISRDEYQEIRARVAPIHYVNYDEVASLTTNSETDSTNPGLEVLGPATTPDPSANAIQNDTREHLERLLGTLEENERIVLSCYYFRGLNLSEIATILDVTESRVSQIHSSAIQSLREHLNANQGDAHSLFLLLLES